MAENDPLDDDDDLELEPVDPQILENERRIVEEKARRAEESVDINEAYEEPELIYTVTWDDLQGIRFTTRHTLIATALLAVALTAYTRAIALDCFLLASLHWRPAGSSC